MLLIYGKDYDTPDGTGIRDYIHVNDLADGHLQALNYITTNNSKINIFNLGTGIGYSVLEMVKTFESISKKKSRYALTDRREGDISISIADPSLAYEVIGWKANLDLKDMCKDTWNKFLYELEARQ